MLTTDTVRISVRTLVEFILRSGDIDNRYADPMAKDAMQLGSRLHRKIQSRMGDNYHAEVPLAVCVPCGDFQICVEGRADGVIDVDPVTIDEIKGVMRPLEHIREPVPVHLAQAKCYAYMYLAHEDAQDNCPVKVRMTYASLESEEVRYFYYDYTFGELRAWFDELTGEYRRWAEFERNWKRIRGDSIHAVDFPYAWRRGQKELAGQVYRSIRQGKMLFIQAPTGTGKTLSTVFPAVKAMGEGLGDKIFYLTARTIARTVALDAFELLCGEGLRIKRIIITAKEKICKCEHPDCNPDGCPYAKGHYDRINDAIYELITRQDCFTRSTIEEAADRYMVCPFELSLDLSGWMDAVICDYNYAFHPRSRLKRYFGEGIKGDYLFLVDEAHNLADRGREMFSAALVKEDFLELKKEIKQLSQPLERALGRVNRAMLSLKRECDGWAELEDAGNLCLALMNLYGIMEDILQEDRERTAGRKSGEAVLKDPALREKVLDLYFKVGSFLNTSDLLDDHYIIYDQLLEDKRFMVKLYNVNPASNLQQVMDKARSCVLFSATLLPVDYYLEALSTRKDNYAVYAKTVFEPEKLKVMIGTDTSSRYTLRDEKLYMQLAAYIRETVQAREGNYMVFFPSYRMLEEIRQVLEEGKMLPDGARLIAQHSGMREEEREEFLGEFDAGDGTLVGLCVMGSIFGEGIDLKEDRLIGVIVIGPGLPMVCIQQEILKRYYERLGKDGFYYAYQCPGMNRVLQAAGRVIRTEDDRGIVLLLDERFMRLQYRRMFPREWKDIEAVSLRNVQEIQKLFWEKSSRLRKPVQKQPDMLL